MAAGCMLRHTVRSHIIFRFFIPVRYSMQSFCNMTKNSKFIYICKLRRS